MELENRPLKNSERRAGRICLLVIIGFSATMLVLTCMDIMYRSTGFIIVYSALIVISIALMATILRADTLDSTSEEKEKSNEAMIIAQAAAEMNKKLAEKKASEDAASSSENETDPDDEHESETDDATTDDGTPADDDMDDDGEDTAGSDNDADANDGDANDPSAKEAD